MTNPETKERLVVVGGGQAAAQIIEVARQEGFTGPIVLVSDEACLPYQRPPLSKQYLSGGRDRDWLLYRPAHFYPHLDIDVRLGRRAIHIDRDRATVHLDSDEILGFDRLALATGCQARRLPSCAAGDDRIFYVRTLEDVDRLRTRLAEARKVAIVGAGFIGLEAAAVLVAHELEVVLLAQGERLLPRLAGDALASFLQDQHRRNGVDFAFNCDVLDIQSHDQGCAVVCRDGRRFDADLAIVGIGAVPNTQLAEAAGLVCDNGIVVDELARTSDPRIVAAGDCTNHPGWGGGRMRLETVHNAVEQGRTAGATLAGKSLPYSQIPWVWSDQYGYRIQSVGITDAKDQSVLRGDPASGRFSVFNFRDGLLSGATFVNQPRLFGAVRQIMNGRIPLSPEEAADDSVDLCAVVKRPACLEFDTAWPSIVRSAELIQDWGHD